MSFVKIDRNNFELISLLLKPSVHFVSSSSDPDFIVSGSQFVAPVRSKCIKQVIDLEASFNNLVEDITDGDSNISKYNIDNFARAVSLHEAQTLAAQSKFPQKASLTLTFTTDQQGSVDKVLNGELIRLTMYGASATQAHDITFSNGTAARATSFTDDGDGTFSAVLGISDTPTDDTLADSLVTLFSSIATYTAFKGGVAGKRSVTITAINESSTLNIVDNGTSVTSLHVGEAVGGIETDAPPHKLTGSLERYMDLVPSAPKDVRFNKSMDIFRFDPPFKYTKNSTVKNVIRNIMMPAHRHRYENCGFWYSNYNSLNFFGVSGSDGEVIPTGSCLIYPNVDNCYGLETEFSLNFWINPRYSKLTDRGDYRAGTIYHMPTQMAVSLVSGSDIDVFGEPENFKILLQFSQSADIEPSKIGLTTPAGVYPNDLIFTSSSDLKKNHWHHVCVQWSASSNNRTGSIFIDDNETYFHLPSASIGSASAVPSSLDQPSPSGLTIGNFYFGNLADNSKLFHLNVTASSHNLQVGSEGVVALDTTSPPGNPAGVHSGSMFTHPLQAEIHDLRLYNQYYDRGYGNTFGARLRFESPKNDLSNLKLWVPPYFFPDTPVREVLLTPFQKSPGTGNAADRTGDPFNVQFSFGVGGKLINLENFVRDFAQNRNPRLLFLTASAITSSIEDITADQYVYEAHFDPNFGAHIDVGHGPFSPDGDFVSDFATAPYPTGSLIKRNMTIMPCDNGLFKPHYDILENSYMSGSDLFKKPNGVSDYSIISLERLIPTASLYPGLIFEGGSIFEDICGTAPDNPGVAPGSVLTIAQRTKDVSSNEISIFDISNLYYGNKIHPGSFEIHDENLTGSQGNIKITLRDNGRGSIYRADAATKHAEWNSVGNIMYEEGIVVIKSPHLLYFCKDKTNIKFKGEQNIHTMIVNVPANEWNFTSSSNATYTPITPTTGANDQSLKSVYITGVNIHDDNFNIIAKANFAQPIVKTQEDEFVIRLKQDF